MKTTFAAAALAVSLVTSYAHDSSYSANCATALGYASPVVYQAPVIYQAPVTYYAPVYYVASAASTALYVASGRACPSPSTVIHITGGRGTYITSNCDFYEPSVIVIGSQYARRDGGYRTGWHQHGNRFNRHGWFR